MATTNRASVIGKSHKVLKKHYEAVKPPTDRSVFEHLLYACLLENALPDQADQAFAKLEESFLDWNEIRVTSVTEMSEALDSLPDSKEAGRRLKTTMQSVFETRYEFDLESLVKQGLGKSQKELQSYDGVGSFAVAYVTQHALGGHAVPVCRATLNLFQILGVITDKEAAKGSVPGLERAIPKSKGVEYASLIHQLAAELEQNPFSTRVRGVVTDIAADAKERLPKRKSKKDEAVEADSTADTGAKTAVAKKSSAKKAPTKKAASKKKAKAPAVRAKKNAGKKVPASDKFSAKHVQRKTQ
ncbi:MAG: hypothetical protein NXI22_24905 [bacterium]|nr:hypothetical protein [bacterium]